MAKRCKIQTHESKVRLSDSQKTIYKADNIPKNNTAFIAYSFNISP